MPSAGNRLVERIRAQRSVLVASALSGGLCNLRKRSLPDRAAREADRFVSLLVRTLGSEGPSTLRQLARSEVREGAFAGALREVPAVLKLWRKIFDAAFAESSAQRQMIVEALGRIEADVRAELQRWQPQRFDLVVVGASAGGVTALETLLASLDESLPVSLILVLHVSERTPGVLPLVLARHAQVVVAYALDRAVLCLGHAYVAPPGHHVLAERGVMRLGRGAPVNHVRPSVDVLFESAAEVYRRRLISVVLSGTGRDGAEGTRLVRQLGGVTLTESPGTAQFGGMPTAAVETGAVMHSLPLDRLGPAIERLVREGRGGTAGEA